MDFVLEQLYNNDGMRIVLDERNRSYTCGRGRENDILCPSLLVSRRHCLFLRDSENLYITDLRSSNGIFVNNEAKQSLQMIRLYENDIVGIGCPTDNRDDTTLFIYKIGTIRSSALNEEEENDASILSETILNNNTLQNRVLKRCVSNSIDDITVPNKIAKVIHDNKDNKDCNVNSSKEINSNLSCDNQKPQKPIISNDINNLIQPKHVVIDISAEDDIEIIHMSLAKKVEKTPVNHNPRSAKCSANSNKLNSDKMDVSNIEGNSNGNINKNHPKKVSNINKQDGVLYLTKKLNSVHTNDKVVTSEYELEVTDDEEAHITAKCDETRGKSPIKLIKVKQELKMRFSLVEDVIDLSDDEEGVFPYSQLFDIKCEPNAEDRTEINQECANDEDLNIEKIGLLNVDDEVIILTDNEDEDNPWLERLSRSQLLNEDVKPVFCAIKDEIDLGMWDDEMPSVVEHEMLDTSQIRKEVSPKPCSKEVSPKPRANVDIKTKNKKDDHNTSLPMTEINRMEVDDSPDEPSTKDINKNKHNDEINRLRKKDKQININTNADLSMIQANTMDIDDGHSSKKPSTKGKSKQIVNTDTNLATRQADAMDIDEGYSSKKPSTKGKSKEIVNTDTNSATTQVDAMDIDEGYSSKKPSTKGKSKEIVNTDTNSATTQADAMDIDEGHSKKPSTKDINKSKQKIDTKQNTDEALKNVKEKLLSKMHKKAIIEIEPLNLPSRKRRTDHEEKVKKVHKDKSRSKSITKKTISDYKNDNFYSKEQKRQNEERVKSLAEGSSSEPKPGPSISKDEKKKILEDRKMKLKQIAVEEKKLIAKSDQTINRRIAKPRAKISLKNRGDFLIADQEPQVSKSLPNKSTELPKSSDDQSKEQIERSNERQTRNKIHVRKFATFDKITDKSHQKTDVSKDTVNDIATSLRRSLYLDTTESAPEKNILDFKMIDNDKKRSSTKSGNMSADPTTRMSTLRDRRNSAVQRENSSPNNLKSMLVISAMKSMKKKKVSFSGILFEMRVYEIEEHNTLKKLDWKDAPMPRNKLTIKPVIYTDRIPKLEEFLLRIFMWNPVWLEEQRYLKCEPPIVQENELKAMRLSYDSYNQYYDVMMPLLLLEMWCILTKDFEMIHKNTQRATMMCSIVENSTTFIPIPSTNLLLTTLTFEVLVNKDDLNKQTHPIFGDLVYLEYVTNVNDKQIFQKIFGYVTNMQHMIITDFTHYNKDLRNYVKNPYSVITYTLLTRPLEHTIPINRVHRVRTVMYLRSNIRLVQALQYLPHSPLLQSIVNPKIENYQLPPLNEQYVSSSLVTKDDLNPKQLEAVFRVTGAVLKKEAKLCFIQGPPGTGKTKVIINLVSQILYGGRQNEKVLRILICAPSNAAIDEIVLRLLSIRSTLKQKHFNMVRIGRLESMHPMARNISVTELARRHLIKMTKTQKPMLNSGSANFEDIAILQARINSLEIELQSNKVPESKRNLLMNKRLEMTARYELMRSGKLINEVNPKDRAKYQKMAEKIIITGANIIACTLSSCYTNQMESIFGGHNEKISVCIVDEATQSCEAETLIPLMLGVNTLVLVGDPNQLPATVISQRAKRLGLDQSIFSRMQNVFASQSNSPIIMLNTQYRMDYAISYWPNRYFYDGKLKNAAESRMKFPIHSYRVLHHDFTQNDDKFSNTTEAEFVANIIFTMLTYAKWETGNPTISLGVLTPYNNQRTLVINKINEKISFLPDSLKKKIDFEVNTVDGFQGQERDVIIMSCVRSNGIGFMSDRQRLCVALTRAKHSLILCGNFNTFMRDPMWKALLSDARNRGILCLIKNASPTIIKKSIIKESV